ncbi:unnamed protein product [Closterium sp. Naga37s-1]|nr:unnamed protein product [Closterium sp. Naga37s-1]
MTFYPSSAAETAGLCAVIERLTPSFASLALAADKGRRGDLNRALSDWKTGTAGRIRDIALPKLGLFRDARDKRSPWAAPKARSASRVKERIGLTLDGKGTWGVGGRGRGLLNLGLEGVLVSGLRAFNVNVQVTDAIRFWDTRKGRLSNSAGVNAQIVDGLRECALVDVMAAIEQFQPVYDPTTSSWAWGRHGLRLSASGIEHHEGEAQAPSESAGDADDASLT